MIQERKAFLCKDGQYVEVPFDSLKRGDVFKLMEPDGTYAPAPGNWPDMAALSDAKDGEILVESP